MVKPEPTLAELDLEDGEKLLDWMNDDYAMNVIDDRVYFRDADKILDYNALLNDNIGQTKYFPSMADPGNEVIKISLPRTVKICINTCARYHTQRRTNIFAANQSQTNQQVAELDPAKVMRILALHGMSIYEFKWGCEIDRILHDSMQEHMNCDSNSIELFDIKNLTTYEDRFSLRVSDKFKMYLNTWSESIGLQSQLMCGFWILLSLNTHNGIKQWYPLFDTHIQQVSNIIKLKVRLMNSKDAILK